VVTLPDLQRQPAKNEHVTDRAMRHPTSPARRSLAPPAGWWAAVGRAGQQAASALAAADTLALGRRAGRAALALAQSGRDRQARWRAASAAAGRDPPATRVASAQAPAAREVHPG
jgi:hypothetical protein